MSATSSMIIVDVGSTTTKALLFESEDGSWCFVERGESPTTVEAPFEDVMIGVNLALGILEKRSRRRLLDTATTTAKILTDTFLATSSAGGGLKLVVSGATLRHSASAAERAASGAGAVLLAAFGSDDGLSQFTRLEKLRAMRPDMILLAGGFEGANIISFVVEMCDFIRSLKPRSAFDYQRQVPVIYAGASSGAAIIHDLLGAEFYIKVVPNLKPSHDSENLEPTREAIHEVFIEHVMANAPGYPSLLQCVDAPVLPTPAAVGEILTRYAKHLGQNLLAVDIGGATTDVFSVVENRLIRSVSANVGMSYSIGNVYARAGYEGVERWLEQPMSEAEVLGSVGAKLFNPTTIPALLSDLMLEQAIAREGLRLAYADHYALARHQPRSSLFDSGLLVSEDPIEMETYDKIIGSGGVLSNAPTYRQATAMLLDALEPVGITEVLLDKVFMLPHLGAFAQLDEIGALELLQRDCLIPLATVIAPKGAVPHGVPALSISGRTSEGRPLEAEVCGGEVIVLPLSETETAEIRLRPHAGVSWPQATTLRLRGGQVGLVFDLRGRPLPPLATGDRYHPW